MKIVAAGLLALTVGCAACGSSGGGGSGRNNGLRANDYSTVNGSVVALTDALDSYQASGSTDTTSLVQACATFDSQVFLPGFFETAGNLIFYIHQRALDCQREPVNAVSDIGEIQTA